MSTTPPQKPGKSTQTYRTPDDFRAAVLSLLQIPKFCVDLAAEPSSTFATVFITKEIDALRVHRERGWDCFTRSNFRDLEPSQRWLWLNPPYSDIEPWAKACAETARLGGQVAFLVPASVGANWFRDHVAGKARVLFLNGRLHFMPDQPTWGYPKDCILILFSAYLQPGYEVWTWKTPKPRSVRNNSSTTGARKASSTPKAPAISSVMPPPPSTDPSANCDAAPFMETR